MRCLITRHSITRSALVASLLASCLLLASCQGFLPQDTLPFSASPALDQPLAQNADYYLEKSRQSSANNRTDWQLLAIRALIKEQKFTQANQLYGQLAGDLTLPQITAQQLLLAQLQQAAGKNRLARQTLQQLDPDQLSSDQQQSYYQTFIDSSANSPSLDTVRAYIAQQPLLAADQQQQNRDATWQTLLKLAPSLQQGLAINADEQTLRGWLDLLQTYQANKNNRANLQQAVSDWQTRYPYHPAHQLLPSSLLTGQTASTAASAAKKIALLLPLAGPAQTYAAAILSGFNDAKNGIIPEQFSTDTDNANSEAAPVSNDDVTLTRYDSSSAPIATLMQQITKDNNNLVVGPLLKDNVQQLMAIKPLTISTLALNEPENTTNSAQLCYFALSPENEAQNAAEHIFSQQKKLPLLLIPNNNFGQRVMLAFANKWRALGGGAVLQQTFMDTQSLKQQMNNGKGIKLSGTLVNLPATRLPAGAPLPIALPPTPSAAEIAKQPVDAIYVVATPEELTLLKPMIDMNINNNQGPTLYASSRSLQAQSSADFRFEMNGIQFSDIPLLVQHSPLAQRITAKFNNDYFLVRLYAMGADAWNLAHHYPELRQQHFQTTGYTGKLNTTSQCIVTRDLQWFQYQQGERVPLSN